MFTAVCFDLDGTLLASRPDFKETILAHFTRILAIPVEKQLAFESELLSILPKEHVETSADAIRLALTRVNLDAPDNVEVVCQQVNRYYADTTRVMTGVIELLEFLTSKNIPLALISNGPADMQVAAFKAAKLESFFKTVLISGAVGLRKPDARLFRLACQNLSSEVENTLMIGDNPVADIQAALGAGLQAVQMGTREGTPEGVKCVHDIPELHRHLQGIFN